jgi:hypothetical protein
MQLHVETVHQPQRLELILSELAGHATFYLAAELLDALGDQLFIEFVVTIHRGYSLAIQLIGSDRGSECPNGFADFDRAALTVLDYDLDRVGIDDLASLDRLFSRTHELRGLLICRKEHAILYGLGPTGIGAHKNDAPID